MKRLVSAALLACLSSSCIVVASRCKEAPPRNTGIDKGTAAFSINVWSDWEWDWESTWTISNKAAAQAVTNSLLESGYFSDVRESSTPRDISLIVDIEMAPSEHYTTVTMISGFFLAAIPVWMTQELALSVEATLPSSVQRQYTYRGEAVEILWLPLAVGAPFMSSTAAASDVIHDGVAEVVRQMVADGCLPVTEAMRAAATGAPVPPSAGVVTASGTGFFVGDSGRVVTCQHVVEGATSITIEVNGQELFVELEAIDVSNDLALLKLQEGARPDVPSLAIACTGGAHVGQHVFTVGFPLVDIQGKEAKYTDGSVGSLSGFGGDTRLLQVSVPVQPGNSGGPLLNDRGEVVGVVQARLGDIETLRAAGALPQGVNYAIKSAYLCAFLGSHAEHLPSQALERFQAIEAAQRAVCIVRARRP